MPPEAGAVLPPRTGSLYSVTRTPSEVSVVCEEALAPAGAASEPGWRALSVEGPIPFEVTGVLASLTEPLARAGISVFALATYDTDFILVKEGQAGTAESVLRAAGFAFAERTGGAAATGVS